MWHSTTTTTTTTPPLLKQIGLIYNRQNQSKWWNFNLLFFVVVVQVIVIEFFIDNYNDLKKYPKNAYFKDLYETQHYLLDPLHFIQIPRPSLKSIKWIFDFKWSIADMFIIASLIPYIIVYLLNILIPDESVFIQSNI